MGTPPHLANVQLHEYTENIERTRAENADGTCGALPAEAFRAMYPKGCRRGAGHQGHHSAIEASAKRADMLAAAKAAR